MEMGFSIFETGAIEVFDPLETQRAGPHRGPFAQHSPTDPRPALTGTAGRVGQNDARASFRQRN
jgi:hypothetical protein